MSTNARALMAFNAMKAIGISGEIVKPVLKNLLKVYDKNWQLIEDENYRVLADAIFEYEENRVNEKQKVEADSHDESGPRLKRLRKKYQEDEPPPPGETSMRRQKGPTHDQLQNGHGEEGMEPSNLEGVSGLDAVPLNIHIPRRNEEHSLPHDSSIDESEEAPQLHLRRKRSEPEPISSHIPIKDKGKEPLVLPPSCTRIIRVVPTPLRIRDDTSEPMSNSPLAEQRNKTNGPLSSHSRENRVVTGGAPTVVCTNEAKSKPGADQFPKEISANGDQSNRLINPKSEPSSDDFLPPELPVAVTHPPSPDCRRAEDNDRNVSNGHHSVETSSSRDADAEDEGLGGPGTACNNGEGLELANVTEATPANVDIVSSNSGEVKISLSCNYPQGQPNFHLPSLDVVLKMVEDKCLESYKITEPNFSLMNVMKEMCQCFSDLANDSPDDNNQENSIHIKQNLDLQKKSTMNNSLGATSENQDSFQAPASSLNRSLSFHSSVQVIEPQAPRPLALDGMDDSPGTTIQPTEEVLARPSGETEKPVKPTDPEFPNERDMRVEQTDPGSSSPLGFIGVQNEMSIPDDIIPEDDTPGFLRPLHDVNDIAKGEENFRISAVNEVSSEPYPPLFFYIPQNIIFRSAHVKHTLSRIVDEDCCLGCFGDCMSSCIPCACARVTGGDFAYTLEGFLEENFLNECISMNRYPQNHLFYCESCPLERCKNGDLSDPCKGHLERKFIKECWSKCGCNKQCGNRVVQRGISWNLQVFLTVEGKGWGLRTLDDLPRGTFVCEYVGEILTSKELNERNTQIVDGDKQTCPVLLDAAWRSDGVVKDKEALCLDATFYGNVARFINHRCFDANLIEIPVEVESPNHRYYHVALFTTRDVEALEELTWDYGIDFGNSNHPVKGFRCRCGSKSCRDMKRSQKAKLNPLVLR